MNKAVELVEAIKTLNLTFDGKLNSETLTELAQTVMPYFYMVQIKSLIIHILWAGAVVITGYLIGKQLVKFTEQ